MNLIRFFARRGMLANVLTLMVLFIGAGVLSQIRMQELPDAAFPQVDIVTSYPGSSAQDVEQNITNRLEKELRSVEGLRQFESTSSNGLSQIMLELSPDANADKMLRDIQQAVDRVTNLPADLPNPPVVTQRDTGSSEVLRFAVTGPDDYATVQGYSRQLEKQLRQLPGVGAVAMTGFREREFWIAADPDKLSRYQLTLDDLRNAVVNRNLSLSGGLVESWSQEQRLVTLTQYHSIEELQQLVIKTLPAGGLVRLKDVARVFDNFEQARETGMINGDNGILFSVSKTPGADISKTVRAVEQLLARETARLDHQFAFPVSLNIADDMDSKFTIVATNGLMGLGLVLLVLSLFLKRRIAFWVAISIPVCVFGVVALLPLTGQVLDSITLAALLLVIGIIVDDSVIVAEAIYQQWEHGQPPIEAAVNGVSTVFQPVLANLMTTALVFIPMFFLPGSLGLLTVVIPSTVLLALMLSMLECTFLMPAHLAHSLSGVSSVKGDGNGEKADWFDGPREYYRQWLARALGRKKTVLAIALLLLVGCFALVSTMKIDFFPREAARYILVTTEVKPGTLLEQVGKDHQELEDIFRSLPENERQSFEMSYASPVSAGRLTLTPYSERSRSADEIVRDLKQQLADSKTLDSVRFDVDANGPPGGDPVAVRVVSDNPENLAKAVNRVEQWMRDYPGLININTSDKLREPQLRIVPNYDWLARYQLTVNDLARTLRTGFDGDTVTATWIGDDEVDIRLILDDSHRTLEQLRLTKIFTPNGDAVPLSRLAKIDTVNAPRQILHMNGSVQVLISAQIDDERLSPEQVAGDLLAALTPEMPADVRLETGGEAEETGETLSGLMVAFPVAIIAIYLVLMVLFNSLLQPLLVISVIPFGFAAALLALKVHLQPVSLFAMIGVLGMTGVIVNNALVLISQANDLKAAGSRSTRAVILDAASGRLRPILLTSITTVAGLTPLAYGIGGTDIYMGPMSLTLGYGLLLSLPVVLFVLPCLYLALDRVDRNRISNPFSSPG